MFVLGASARFCVLINTTTGHYIGQRQILSLLVAQRNTTANKNDTEHANALQTTAI